MMFFAELEQSATKCQYVYLAILCILSTSMQVSIVVRTMN